MLEKRKSEFDLFYKELIPALVEFVGRLGIQPAHGVLNHAVQYAPYLTSALRDMTVDDEQDRTWFLTRMGYFIGEYFAQKYGGCWYVNDAEGSRYFARFVVGRFARIGKPDVMIDPFEIAQAYVDVKAPRQLDALLSEVEAHLI
ncbi:MAG: hypothetical protein ACN6OP_21085 [Pseudomonadales bacterium]